MVLDVGPGCNAVRAANSQASQIKDRNPGTPIPATGDLHFVAAIMIDGPEDHVAYVAQRLSGTFCLLVDIAPPRLSTLTGSEKKQLPLEVCNPGLIRVQY